MKARVLLTRHEYAVSRKNFDSIVLGAGARAGGTESLAPRGPSVDGRAPAVWDDDEAATRCIPCNPVGAAEGRILEGDGYPSTGNSIDLIGSGVRQVKGIGTRRDVVEEAELVG